MKKWLVLIWLLIPVGLLSYHFGPGQDVFAFRLAQEHLSSARQLEKSGHLEEAIDEYGESLAALPIAEQPSADVLVARDQLRLAQIRGRFQLGRLAETIENLHLLIGEVEREHGPHSPLAYDVRDYLGRVHYQAMVALRLESAEEDVWRRHWELSRQNFRFLAEHSTGRRNELDRKNLEVVIKSFNRPTPSFSAPAGGSATTAGLNPVLTPPPPAGDGRGPPTTIDARPRQPTPDMPDPVTDERELGS